MNEEQMRKVLAAVIAGHSLGELIIPVAVVGSFRDDIEFNVVQVGNGADAIYKISFAKPTK